jgi:hypothetical protein
LTELNRSVVLVSKPEAPAKDPRQSLASGPSLALQAYMGLFQTAAVLRIASAEKDARVWTAATRVCGQDAKCEDGAQSAAHQRKNVETAERHAACNRPGIPHSAVSTKLARGASGEVGGMVALPLAILFANELLAHQRPPFFLISKDNWRWTKFQSAKVVSCRLTVVSD